MSSSYRSLLRNVPMSSTLLPGFLAKREFDPGPEFSWEGEEHLVARQLADRVASYPDPAIRDRVIADLGRIALLADAAGIRQMRTVCGDQPVFTDAFQHLETPEERALWLHEHHLTKFEEALEARFFDEQSVKASSSRHDLKVKREVDRSEAACTALEQTIAAFYRRKHGSGQSCQVEIIDRHVEGTVQVTVYVQDLSNHQTEFDEGRLRRRRSFPAIELALNYHPKTGFTDTVAKGGREFHAMLVAAFAEHLLHHRVRPERIERKVYRLDALRHGVTLANPARFGLEAVRLKSITLWDVDTGLRSIFAGTGRGNRQPVEEQIAAVFPDENPLRRNLAVSGAEIALHFYPEAGKRNGRTLTLVFGRQGHSNLDRLDEKDRMMVESLLVLWGLIPATQPDASPDPTAPTPLPEAA